jgi:hypothetical protein
MGSRGQGFTLFEVMISLMVITIAILSTLMILPVGLRAEHRARSQVVAAATTLTLMENFHNPLVSFRGHGAMAPDLSHNLNVASPDQPPTPGWANRLRDLNLTSSTYQPDFEHMLSGWVQGVSPIPLVIARRLDSDGDEIQNILDQGGYLFYTDPSFVRGLSITANHDTSPVINPPPEAQKLIFAVSGYAQENTLPSHPLESLPWYEIYPFPPEWVALRAHGQEFRRGPINLVAHWIWNAPGPHNAGNDQGYWSWIDPTSNPTRYYGDVEGRSYNYTRVWTVNDQNPGGIGGGSRQGLEYGESCMHSIFAGVPSNTGFGNSGWNPVYFDPAPSNYQMLNLNSGQMGNYANNPIDADDPIDAQATPAMAAWYHGRNWRYFHENFPGSPWDLGWVAFERLAGFNWDVGGNMSQLAYAQTDPNNTNGTHYERAGWLPCLACILNPDSPSFDGEWWSQGAVSNGGGGWSWPNNPVAPDPGWVGGSDPNPPHLGYLPSTPPNDTRLLQYPPSDQDDPTYNSAIGAPASMPPPATYEMRANYRDRAIDLWNAVTSNLNVYHPSKSNCQGHTPDVENTEVDCDMYEYGPQELDNFLMVDPSALTSTPHPAQVMALSYLAHAAMMMTGWDVPFSTYASGARMDWDILTWAYFIPPGGGWTLNADPNHGIVPSINYQTAPYQFKDAKLINPGTTAAAGQNNVMVRNDSLTDMCFYAGDEICFEQDYREWFHRSTPNPTWQTAGSGYTTDLSGFAGGPNGNLLASCRRYRIRNDTYVVAGQDGTITVDPPLVNAYPDKTTSWPDSWWNDHYHPAVDLSVPHPQSFIRICNEHDRAFARKVHEMCMEWALRYCADNPYDQGAPRMMNHQVMMDKPLEILDLFMDAAVGATSNNKAQRVPQNLPTAGLVSNLESFYRWMTPPNQEPKSWFQTNHVASGNVHELSNSAPGRSAFTAWKSLVMNPQLAPPSSAGASSTTPWNWSSDDTRYFPNRHFNAFHRGRELIFWSADWMSYADAETAPSAPLDWAKHARSIWLSGNGKTPVRVKPMFDLAESSGGPQMPGSPWPRETGMPWPPNLSWSWAEESQYAGNPEQGRLWAGSAHNARWYDWVTNSNGQDSWSYDAAGADINLGHWGADRNGNKTLDIGPVPITSRMRAETVARFDFYDPILRLNVNN